MTIHRRADWRPRLSAAIEASRRAALEDCGLFIADCVKAMTDVDLAASYRGRYDTIEEGIALLQADGYGDLCAFAAAHLPELPHVSRARMGDVMAFVSERSGWGLGIVNGERVSVVTGRGVGTLDRAQATRAFAVPE